ncbi:DNA polymerase IV [bacterium BMS3Bbin04]|nr:DNA polymerase IV [bacterium BMS3Bbin04]
MLNNTHIVLRIPGFYANIERRMQRLSRETPLIVCAGDDDRALIISACSGAIRQGARAGLRIGALRAFSGEIIHASPVRYASEESCLCEQIEHELPNPQMIRPGVMHALWSRGRRFLYRAVEKAAVRLGELGYEGAWGIGPGDAVAEIAATIAPIGECQSVSDGGVPDFLAPHPLALLPELSTTHLAMLAEIGVRRFGDLLDLPPEVLRSLFGADGLALRKIALLGTRGPAPEQWRGRKRLGEDTADIEKVREATSNLIADGLSHVLVRMGRLPRAMRLGLLYTDGRATGARITTPRPEHEGSWQRLALEQVEHLWARRVRIAEVRLSVNWGAEAPSDQMNLFVSGQRQFRDRELTHAVTRVRDRWGGQFVRFAVSQ